MRYGVAGLDRTRLAHAPVATGPGVVLELPGNPIPPDGVDATPKTDRPARSSEAVGPVLSPPAPGPAASLERVRAWWAQREEMREELKTRRQELVSALADVDLMLAELDP